MERSCGRGLWRWVSNGMLSRTRTAEGKRGVGRADNMVCAEFRRLRKWHMREGGKP